MTAPENTTVNVEVSTYSTENVMTPRTVDGATAMAEIAQLAMRHDVEIRYDVANAWFEYVVRVFDEVHIYSCKDPRD
ncbi:hypothetical protein [Nocardia sp. NPDC052566]|uniref:hypothetical protein n=1 Tax=Nocardia sp. NPDC052566 TaxID=3364330 RepID=UPI0037CB177A